MRWDSQWDLPNGVGSIANGAEACRHGMTIRSEKRKKLRRSNPATLKRAHLIVHAYTGLQADHQGATSGQLLPLIHPLARAW